MPVKWLNKIAVLIILLPPFSSFCQSDSLTGKEDTVFLKSGSFIIFQGELRYIQNDTFFIKTDSIHEIHLGKKSGLLNSIRRIAYKRKITKDLYQRVFIDKEENHLDAYRTISYKSEGQYSDFSGMIIKETHFIKTRIFGPPLTDTVVYKDYLKKDRLTGHIFTRQWNIQKNLLFQVGDTVNPYIFAENGKHLRRLNFIENAIIQVHQSGEDSVEVYVVTKDVFPWAVNINASKIDFWNIDVKDVNVARLGHQANTGFLIRSGKEPLVKWNNLNYEIKNIRNSFINSYFSISDNEKEPLYQIRLNRSYIPLVFNWGGGLSFSEYRITDTLITRGINSSLFEIKYNQVDYWIGRQLSLFKKENKSEYPAMITPSIRILRTHYTDRPALKDYSKTDNINRTDLLFSLGICKQQYYIENYYYEYGKIEDIPYGFKMKFTGGYSMSELNERTYIAMELAFGDYFSSLGFIRLAARFGTFINHGNAEQGVFNPEIAYTSKGIELGRYHIRNFLTLIYMRGVNRKEGEMLSLNDENGIKGLYTEELKGNDRLNGHLETILFTPLNIWGFRLSAFFGMDYGMIGESNNSFTDNMYYSLTAGIRIKNDFLVFGSYQLGFTWLPNVPAGIDDFQLSGFYQPGFTFFNYSRVEPSIIEYN